MEISYKKHEQIDKRKWNNCVDNSINSLPYAHSDWLDAMCPGWDGIIIGDYDGIFPLPKRRKYGIKYLFLPAFTQQLGLFVQYDKLLDTLKHCLELINENFSYAEIAFNHYNTIDHGKKRSNYILDLYKPLDEIEQGFKTDLTKNLKRVQKFNLSYSISDNVEEAIACYKNTYSNKLNETGRDYLALENLMQKWLAAGRCFIRKVCTAQGELLCVALFVKYNGRIINLASTTLPNGRMMEANHLLYHQLIMEFAGQPFILDFEGSDLPGIARFYQKFGATDQPYQQVKINNLPVFLRWLKR